MYRTLNLLSIILLVSCSIMVHQKELSNQILGKDTNSFDILIDQFAHNIENIWGLNEILVVSPKDYVKYSDKYYTRSHIDFDCGTITIETISDSNPISNLRNAIIKTLLANDEPNNINFYSDIDDVPIGKTPMLYGQVLDYLGRPIRLKSRAINFANYLIKNNLQKRTSGLCIIWFVTIPMVTNHLDRRMHKYLSIVERAAKKYGVDQSLILAIMQIESSFNPYAVSNSDALGLMQVVRRTAGVDVFRMKGKWGKPSKKYLLNPKNNIDIGTAYLAILQNNYLSNILNPYSRRYAVITAYNSGVNSVLKVFSNKKSRAFNIINNMTPDEVYKTLIEEHPSLESRQYLNKVEKAQKNYNS